MNAALTPAFSPARWVRLIGRINSDAWFNRALALAVLLPPVAVLGIATWLVPHASGMGTHQELGLPPCGFLIATGYPCATCGMTTAFAWAAHGHLLTAFATQPAGTVICLLTTITALISLYAIFTGVSLAPLGKLVWRSQFVGLMILMILASWAYTLTCHIGH